MADSEDSQDNQKPIKITVNLVGHYGVGKTSILTRLISNNYETTGETTLGANYKSKTIFHEGKELLFSFWDTAGQDKFHSVIRSYYRSANIVILVYDITNRESFLKLNFWHKEVVEYAPTNVKFMIIGNKSDQVKKRAVSVEEGQEFAEKKYSPFFETSAKNNENIFLIITRLIEIFNNNKSAIVNEIQKSHKKLKIKKEKQQKAIDKKGCC
ncbi:ras-related protein rab-37 [Anaeramoeba flamelloides]|uniref:Ras-related protein rab-37 n=1 Tax=Anaeramoeba flamelloides TaxID=1746091 RepID=A0AAV7ZEA8_9EUKA|nr:ras-related protein rab-37 [Anaeramoeba flamelloides]